MATKKKNFYYVLVFTESGPKYVTSVSNMDRVAYWNENEKPLEFSKVWAEDLRLGLGCNGFNTVVVTSPYELDSQPYRYDFFEINWKEKESNPDESL